MEKRKCKSYFGDYECHVKTKVNDKNGDPVYVDKCLKKAVEALNAHGLKTVASCCGHGIVNPKITIEGLSDGMEVDLKSSKLTLADVSNNEERVTVCHTCNTPLEKFNDGRLFCPSCLKVYKAN